MVLDFSATLPPDGSRVWYFPGALDHGRADIVARVYRDDGSSWIACLAREDAVAGEETSIFVMPCGRRVFIAGGIVDRNDPTSWQPIRVSSPPRIAWSADRDTVVLNDRAAVEAHGREGFLWHGVVGSDIAVIAVTADEIVCNVYDWVAGATVEQRFDRTTGRILPHR